MKLLVFLGGGLLGLVIVRTLLLNPIESIAFSIFWSAAGEGNLMNPSAVFGSSTFWKCTFGFLVCGVSALALYWKLTDHTAIETSPTGETAVPGSWNCPKCRRQNPGDRFVCGGCGTSLI